MAKTRTGKRTTQSSQIGEHGVSLVRKQVTSLGFYWHDRRIDFGVDGVIEIVDQDRNVPGLTVDVQIKSVRERLPSATEAGFTLSCTQEDIDYWLRGGGPVILVFVCLETEDIWFKDLRVWFSNQARRRARRVFFHKTQDRFDQMSATRLLEIATPAGYAAPRLNQPERLISNLLRVVEVAPEIHSARSPHSKRQDAWEVMKQKGAYESGFVLSGGNIYSLAPLDEGPLSALIDGPVRRVKTTDWSGSDDLDVMRKFVQLLNFTLRSMHHRDLAWHPIKKFTYFAARPGCGSTRRVKHSDRGRGRTVLSSYTKPDGETVNYWRHLAGDLRFRRYGCNWFLEIDPTYHYTRDGRIDSYFSAQLIKGMKQRERNPAVRDIVKTWAAFLRGEESLLSTPDRRIVFGTLEEFEVPVGIDERAWAQGRPASRTATEQNQGELQLELV